ncbi:MAG: hypothetical protein HY721_30730 [Planctomycetes bacterium]|nr:hypothetical protein [Planctomycetota bacterium]
MAPRKVKLLLGLALGVAAVLGAGAYLSRRAIQEMLWLHRLRTGDEEVRAAVARRLAEVGSEQAARAIVEGIAGSRTLGAEAAGALGPILERVRPETRAWAAGRLLARLRPPAQDTENVSRGSWWEPAFVWEIDAVAAPLESLLASLGARFPETLPAFAREVEAGTSAQLAATVLAKTWARSRALVEEALGRASPERAAVFLEALEGIAIRADEDASKRLDAPPPTEAREVILEISRGHPKPQIRAVALSRAILRLDGEGKHERDPEVLSRASSQDPDPLVKRAALRIAGALGDTPGTLPLRKVLLGEKDPALLTEAVQARTLWAVQARNVVQIELAPGVVTALHQSLRKDPSKAWPLEPGEVRRLEEVLLEATGPALRDAASAALADRLGDGAAGERAPLRAARSTALRVHEWGVWAEAGTVQEPAAKVASEAPSFVRRSWALIEDILRQEDEDADGIRLIGVTFKPIVFFHSPEPIAVTVRVWLLGGRPWLYFPDSTDLITASAQGRRGERPSVYLDPLASGAQEAAPEASGKAYWDDREGLSPPWILGERGGAAGGAPAGGPAKDAAKDAKGRPAPRGEGGASDGGDELASMHDLVPWLLPRRSPSGADDLIGLGLEWRGLRVGYGAAVEGEPPPLPETAGQGPGSWWARLRRVPSTPVALRGGREGFLFYDGSMRLASPVLVAWADASRRALRVRTRDFLALPRLEDWPRFLLDALKSHGEEHRPATGHVPGAFVVRKDAGRPARGRLLANLPSRSAPATVPLDALDLEGEALEAKLLEVLAAEGLTREEATALVDVWRPELLAAEGLRVLTVLPRWLYDAVLPIEVVPAPVELVRVGVLWKDCSRLEVEKPAGAPRSPFGEPQPIEVATEELRTRRRPLEPGPAERFELGPDGRLLGISPGSNTMHLSGDGLHIAHPRDNLTGLDVYVADLDAKEIVPFARLPPGQHVLDYTFSFDGSRVGMLIDDGGRHRVAVVDAKERALLRYLGRFGRLDWSHFSRDARTLSFLDDGELVVVDLETGVARRPQLPPRSEARYPMLSADGSKAVLVLESKERLVDGQEVARKDLVLVDLAAPSFRRLARIEGSSRPPALSADASRILFTSAESSEEWLHLADLAGERIVRIAPHAAWRQLAALDPGGARAVYSFGAALWTLDLTTGAARKAHEATGLDVREGSVSEDARTVLFRATDPRTRRTAGVYVVRLDGEAGAAR